MDMEINCISEPPFDVPINISSHRSVSQLCIYIGRMDTWAPHDTWNRHEDLWALSVITVTRPAAGLCTHGHNQHIQLFSFLYRLVKVNWQHRRNCLYMKLIGEYESITIEMIKQDAMIQFQYVYYTNTHRRMK